MALSANVGSSWAVKHGSIRSYTAGGTIYRGSVVAVRLIDGKAYAAVLDDGDSYKQIVVGWAMEAASATDTVRVRSDSQVKLTFQGTATGNEGRLACVHDDATVNVYQNSGSGNIVAGRITSVPSSTKVFVDFGDRPLRVATSLYD